MINNVNNYLYEWSRMIEKLRLKNIKNGEDLMEYGHR